MAGFGIQKDGLDSVIVKMDRAPAVYNAGDIFSGNVMVVCLETTPVKGIKVRLTNYDKQTCLQHSMFHNMLSVQI